MFHQLLFSISFVLFILNEVYPGKGNGLKLGIAREHHIQMVVSPDPSNWRLCLNDKFSVLVPNGDGLYLELKVNHVTPHPSIIYNVNHEFFKIWYEDEYNLVLIHLAQSIDLYPATILRTVCLPTLGSDDDIRGLIHTAGSGLMAGWPKEADNETILTLNVNFASEEECLRLWGFVTTGPFGDRVCGYNTATGTPLNPELRCSYHAAGVYIHVANQTILIGFTNTFFSNHGICDQVALQYILILNSASVSWIQRGMSCEPNAPHACGDGNCVRVNQLCDGVPNCSDLSDEDERICNPRNCCGKEELACGVAGPCIRNDSGTVGYCNGVKNCPDGVVESEEFCPANPGSGFQWEMMVFGVIGGGILLLLCAALLLWVVLRQRKPLSEEVINEFLNGDEKREEGDPRRLKYDTSYEYNERDCFQGQYLGNGRFGSVRLAHLHENLVAVKSVNPAGSCVDASSFIALLAELKTMMYIESEGGHENVVRFLGACTAHMRQYKLNIAMEYCKNGSLEAYLQQHAPTFNSTCRRTWDEFTGFMPAVDTKLPLETKVRLSGVDLVKWSMQISQGMMYLTSKRIVHGDLAARNVLLDGGLIAKLCDFGLSHCLFGSSNEYTTTTRREFPWRWAAPETLQSKARVYNMKSDVWSFGILLWEVFSLGELPWRLIVNDETELLRLLQPGGENEETAVPFPTRPRHCTNNEIYELMRSCWKLNPDRRPSFKDLTEELQNLYDKMCCTIGDSEAPSNSTAEVQAQAQSDNLQEPCNSHKDVKNSIPTHEYVLQADFTHSYVPLASFESSGEAAPQS